MGNGAETRTSATLLGRLREIPEDPDAWREFVARYAPRIVAWCRAWRLQNADAQDVTQAVLQKLATHMRHFAYDPSRSFRGWLKTLAHHAWRDLVDGRQFRERGLGDESVGGVLESIEAREDLFRRLDEAFEREILEEAMARVRLRVRPQTWEAFRLQALEGHPGVAVASALGMSVASAYVAKNRITTMLREEVIRLRGPDSE